MQGKPRTALAGAPAAQREFGRRPGPAHAWIDTGGRSRLPCRIVRQAEHQALLTFFGAVPHLPFRFRLLLGTPLVAIECEQQHVGTTAIGVAIVSPATPEPDDREKGGRSS